MDEVKNPKINEFLDSLSFEEANKYLEYKDIFLVMNGEKEKNFSLGLKKLIILVIGLLFPVSMVLVFMQESLEASELVFSKLSVLSAELIIIGFMLYQFFKPYPSFLRNWGYKNYCYSMAKTAYISYFIVGLGMDDGNYIVTFFLVSFCVASFLILYKKVEQNRTLEEMNSLFNKNYKTSKLMSIVLKLSGVLVGLILIGMQIYRMNAWWINSGRGKDSVLSNSLLDNLIGIGIGIPMLLIITLVPTYFLFHATIYIRGEVIKKYSEEFRIEYEFTRKEWYGE